MKRPRNMTDEMIAQAQAEARADLGTLLRKPHVEARATQRAAEVAAIRAEWEAKAAQGDMKARRLLRECYPEAYVELDRAAAVLAAPAHWQDGQEDES